MELLTDVVNNSEINRMTVRNVGIVFAPTLNIPAPVITMFLNDYDLIFGPPLDDDFAAEESTTEAPRQSSSTPSDLKIQIPNSEAQSQQDANKRSNMPDTSTSNSGSPADSFRGSHTGSTSPVVSPEQRNMHDLSLPSISENATLRPGLRGGRPNFRATISGMNGLLIPPGEEGTNGGGAAAKQKRRESGMIYMDMDRFNVKTSESTIE